MIKAISITLGTLALTLSHSAFSQTPQIKSSYSAELKSYNKFRPKRVHKSKVVMTPHGVRVETRDMFVDSKPGLYIQNFKTDKAWVVDPKNKIYSFIENNDKEDEFSSVGGIMATRPCLGSDDKTKKITGQKVLHDDKIIIWSCTIRNNITVKQGYSQKWNTVVWEHLPNGDISELVGIKSVDYEADFFAPSKKYREVTLQEFYTGAPALKSYTPNQESKYE